MVRTALKMLYYRWGITGQEGEGGNRKKAREKQKKRKTERDRNRERLESND